MISELECRCETCHIELFVLDVLTTYFPRHCRNEVRKVRKHIKNGHKISNEIFYVHRENGIRYRISSSDRLTRYVLEQRKIIIP